MEQDPLLLTDEEKEGEITKFYDSLTEYVSDTDHFDAEIADIIAQAQLAKCREQIRKEVINWLNEACPHGIGDFDDKDEVVTQWPRHTCIECRREIGLV